MRPDLAARVSGAVSAHLFAAIEIRANSYGAWTAVRGREKRGSGQQRWDGMSSTFVVDTDEVHLLVADFPDGRPDAGWEVRFDGSRVRVLTGPAATGDSAGQFLRAPLGGG